MEEINITLLVQSHSGTQSYDLRDSYRDIPEIRETDPISFNVICPNSLGEPKIFLQDHSVILNRHNRNGEITEYTVEFNRYLSNHFGVTSLAVAFANSDELIRVTPVNVFATKINKEQAEKILEYLSSKMEDITNLCFSKTQIGSNSKPGKFTDTLTKIAFSRKILETLSANRQRFSMQPCKRSIEKLEVSNYDDSSHITDKDISWLFQHLDQLYPSPIDVSKVSIHNRNYSIDQIQRTVKEVDTNLFENQVIHGFLLSLKSFLIAVPSFRKKYQLETPYKDYFTFDSILQKIEAPLMERRFREARLLLQQCNELISFFQKHLPCTVRGAIQPVLTSQAKRLPHYERSFRLIDAWYKLGQPAWSGTNYLFGLKSLDKLYEFFCLYKITDTIAELGYTLTNVESSEPDRESGLKGKTLKNNQDTLANYYRFESQGRALELFYEPTIWSFSDLSKKGEIIDAFHSKQSYKPYYTPDFLVKVDDGGNFPKYYVFDSKYSTESQTRERHLPAIIEKYFLKLKAIDKTGEIDSRAIQMVYALIPKTFTQEHGYHGGAFNIFDRHASSPFFGFLKLTPEEDRPLHKLLAACFSPTPYIELKSM
jgi:hypothetical protein